MDEPLYCGRIPCRQCSSIVFAKPLLFADFPLVVHEILGRHTTPLTLTTFTKSSRTTPAIQTAGFMPATSTKETFRNHSLLSSPSEILNRRRRSASTIKEYILERMMMMRIHYQKRKVMNPRTRSTQNAFVERRIVEVMLTSTLHERQR